MRGLRLLGPAVCLLASAALFPARSQTVVSTHSGVVYFFEGSVFMGDQPLEQKFGRFPDIAEGGELRTQKGHAEVLLTPGVFLRIGDDSRIRMLSTSLADTKVELLAGSAIIESRENAPKTSASVIFQTWTVRLPEQGVYRLDANPPQVWVYKGEAQVSADGKTPVTVKEGESLPLAPVLVTDNADPPADPFSNWAMSRSQAVYADNTTASEIFDDPTTIDPSGLALGGFTYFPLTGVIGSGYGMSFWSPLQSNWNLLYLPRYPLYSVWPGLRTTTISPYGMPYPSYGITSRPIGGVYNPGTTFHPGTGVHPGIGGSSPRLPVGPGVRLIAPRAPAGHMGGRR